MQGMSACLKDEDLSGFKVYPTEESLIHLHKDATRYRWLREHIKEIVDETPDLLDKTIDERL